MKLALALLALATAASAHTLESLELDRPEGARQYLLVRPELPAAERRPLVILLHGHGGSARQLLGRGVGAAPLSPWLDIADREGLLLLAPEGARGIDDKQGWNDCRADAPFNPRTDDLGLLTALIEEAIARHDADPTRVYVMGMSNGGMMALRLAVELPRRVAAVAAVGASMPEKSVCEPPKVPISVLIIAGDADPLVPYAGGDVRFRSQQSRGRLLGIEQTARLWRELADLPERAALSMDYAHLQDDDPTRAHRTVWGADAGQAQVALIRIRGGGHVEPSRTHRIGALYRGIVGPQNADFESAEEAWQFFRNKSRAP